MMDRLGIRFSAWALLCMVMMASCGKNVCKAPIGDARCEINLLNPDAYNLNHAGGMVKAYGGNMGLWIVNTGLEYAVYEATCPHCGNVATDTISGWEGLLQCRVCESRFSTYSDGYPLNGSVSECPLYRYSCVQEGYSLHIYN